MNNKKLISLLSKRMHITIYQDKATGGQWIGDSIAVYIFDNVPFFTADQFKKLYDLKESQFVDIVEGKPNFGVLYENYLEEDEPLKILPTIIDNYNIFAGVKNSDNILFVDSDHLKPFENSSYTEFYMRRFPHNGIPLVAVKEGMLLEGCVAPALLDDKKIEHLRYIANNCDFCALSFFKDDGEKGQNKCSGSQR